MRIVRIIRHRLRSLLQRSRVDRDLRNEVEIHLEQLVKERMTEGMSKSEATLAAKREFGPVSLTQEQCRDMRATKFVDDLMRDSSFAFRTLAKSPAFTLTALLSLALGIGANTAFFSVINALILAPLPVTHPEELVQVRTENSADAWFSNPQWEAIRDHQDVFRNTFAFGRWQFNLAPAGEARFVPAYYVSGQFFPSLGVQPAMGRLLQPEDDVRGCSGAAVISHGFWSAEYARNPEIVGKTIALNGHKFPIIGVAQQGFTGLHVGTSVAVFVPICAEDQIRVHPPNILNLTSLPTASSVYRWLYVFGRLRPGVTSATATAGLHSLAPIILRLTVPHHWSRDLQNRYTKRTFETRSAKTGYSSLRVTYSKTLGVLMAISGIVLLIGCANVANLVVARSLSREREIGTRVALGSSKGALVQQFLIESLLLSTFGTALAVVLARISVKLLLRFLDISLSLAPDARMLGFNVGVAVITGLMVGAAPALWSTQVQPNDAMKAGSRLPLYRNGSRLALRQVLLTLQISLTLGLVVVAGLMLTTLVKLNSIDPGFKSENVLLMNLDFRTGNPTRQRYVWQVLDAVRSASGIQSASLSGDKPLCGCGHVHDEQVQVEGIKGTVFMDSASDGYFRTLGVPLLAGREFNVFDTTNSPLVAVINESAAKSLFNNRNPIGRYYRVVDDNSLGPPVEIVGVAADSKIGSLRETDVPAVFTARRQSTWSDSSYEFELRTQDNNPAKLIPQVKNAVSKVDPQAVLEFTTLSQRLSDSIDRERLLAFLSLYFGILGLVLSVTGLHGTLAYNITRRRKEIGIRLAIGAQTGQVQRMLVFEVGMLVGIGIAVGLGLASLGTRLVASFLYGIHPNDPLTIAVSITVLSSLTMAAAYFHGRRASAMEPLGALRDE